MQNNLQKDFKNKVIDRNLMFKNFVLSISVELIETPFNWNSLGGLYLDPYGR